jgi:ribosome-associated protein
MTARMSTTGSTRRSQRTPALIKLEKQALAALTDMKAVNIKVLDVRALTDVADTMIIASGNSDRHVRAIADNVITEIKGGGRRPMGVEGARDGEWVLVDLQDVLVHVMLPRVREFYALEQLWEPPTFTREASRNDSRPKRKHAPGKAAGRPKPSAGKPRPPAGKPRPPAGRPRPRSKTAAKRGARR